MTMSPHPHGEHQILRQLQPRVQRARQVGGHDVAVDAQHPLGAPPKPLLDAPPAHREEIVLRQSTHPGSAYWNKPAVEKRQHKSSRQSAAERANLP